MSSLTSHCAHTSSCPCHHSLLLHTAVCHPSSAHSRQLVGNLQHEQGCLQCLHRQPPSPGLLRKPGHGQSTAHRPTLALALAPPRPSTCLLSLYLHWFSVHCSRLTADKAAKQIIVDTTRYRCNCRRKPFIKLIHKYDCMIGVTADYYHDRRRYV